jgi:methylated-DNA-[protein]-cysteine S-methyltransferase
MGTDQEAFAQKLAERHKGEISLDEERTRQAARQIREYLAAQRLSFSLPIDWSVLTPFQEQVLRATCSIPRGETRSYAEIAAQIGKPNAPRAVGRAEASNPIPLVIPCHRVIGSDGRLHGYGAPGGLETKAWLLELEAASPRTII